MPGKKKGKKKCAYHACKKKLSLVERTTTCKCGLSFCATHRLPESHECTYDYKQDKVVVVGVTTDKVPPI